MNKQKKERLIVGISGASGAIYAVKVLEFLQELSHIETHLVVSNAAEKTLQHEMQMSLAQAQEMADICHDFNHIGASIASGSFQTLGMLIVPCSIKTLSAVAHSMADNLLIRAADVTLKERRPLVLAVRETPLHLGHLRSMTAVTEMGGIIAPPVPALYTQANTLDQLATQTAARLLDLFKLEVPSFRWGEDQ